MKNTLIVCLLLLFATIVKSQSISNVDEFNFDFERISNGVPLMWENFGLDNYRISVDLTNVKEGKYSTLIEHIENSDKTFRSLAFPFPKNYDGKEISLSRFIRTENVNDGYAGLWMRIDPNIAFDNMGDRGVVGTSDWTKYTITLPMNSKASQGIVVGGLLVGSGKMWMDDLQVTIDGKDIREASLYARELLPAETDGEFDEGPGVSFPVLDERKIADWGLMCKVWGFLKYHHPEVANGNHNWDYELFRILPTYLNATNNVERDNILLRWIDNYGSVTAKTSPLSIREDPFLKPDIKWIDESGMSPDLAERLKNIYANRNQGEHIYVRLMPGVGNPEFKNENPYAGMPYPDTGFRLLTLYRYWNMIRYFYPYRYLTDRDWDSVLTEYIPIFISANDELDYEIVALKLIGKISDTHANLWGGRNQINIIERRSFRPDPGAIYSGQLGRYRLLR